MELSLLIIALTALTASTENYRKQVEDLIENKRSRNWGKEIPSLPAEDPRFSLMMPEPMAGYREEREKKKVASENEGVPTLPRNMWPILEEPPEEDQVAASGCFGCFGRNK